jgi:anti-sigma B factor antagonist
MDLILSQRSDNSHEIVEVRGEIDLHSAKQLQDRLNEVLDAHHAAVLVDMTWVQFIDSTGLGALVAALNRANELGTTFLLVCKEPRLLKVFEITGLNTIFNIYPTVAQALQA